MQEGRGQGREGARPDHPVTVNRAMKIIALHWRRRSRCPALIRQSIIIVIMRQIMRHFHGLCEVQLSAVVEGRKRAQPIASLVISFTKLKIFCRPKLADQKNEMNSNKFAPNSYEKDRILSYHNELSVSSTYKQHNW